MLERAAKKRAALRVEARETSSPHTGGHGTVRSRRNIPAGHYPLPPFQHLLEVRQQVDCLDCVRKHLAPGGRLILDVFQTDAERMHDPCICARCW